MARPKKDGLEYFSLDVAMDDEVGLIEAEHGLIGFAILIKMFQRIYSNGYYCEWDEKQQILFSNKVSSDRNLVVSVVSDCIRWEIFDKGLYEKYRILTSKRIQNHFIHAVYKRVGVQMIKEYLLVTLPNKKIEVVSVVEWLSSGCRVVSDDRNNDTSRVPDDRNLDATELLTEETEIQQGFGYQSDVQSTHSNSNSNSNKKISNKKTLSRQQKKYAEDSSPYRMAKFLHNKIMAYAESISKGHLVRDADMQKWADECRKIIELDKRDQEEAKRVIDFATTDDFWQAVILSPKNMRKKYTELCMRMDSKKRGKSKKINKEEFNLD